ncbi:MAG: hypothetical protein V4732_18755 [Pseudomonadota bacterium]
MNTENITNFSEAETDSSNLSVAHQIMGKFINELKADAELLEVARRLENVLCKGKLTEVELRNALFGGTEL